MFSLKADRITKALGTDLQATILRIHIQTIRSIMLGIILELQNQLLTVIASISIRAETLSTTQEFTRRIRLPGEKCAPNQAGPG